MGVPSSGNGSEPDMGTRAHILQDDRTTAGGVVLDGIDDVTWNDRRLSYLGARVQCPACNSVGRIIPNGPRPDDDLSGKQPALDGDICQCACNPKPTMIASQDDWTLDT